MNAPNVTRLFNANRIYNATRNKFTKHELLSKNTSALLAEVFHSMAPFQAHQQTTHSNPSAATKRSREDDSDKNSVR